MQVEKCFVVWLADEPGVLAQKIQDTREYQRKHQQELRKLRDENDDDEDFLPPLIPPSVSSVPLGPFDGLDYTGRSFDYDEYSPFWGIQTRDEFLRKKPESRREATTFPPSYL